MSEETVNLATGMLLRWEEDGSLNAEE